MALLQSPHWPFLIDVYFFLGGLAGGAFVIATIAALLDGVRYPRRRARRLLPGARWR